jgi:carbonic anhydrase/acetyltransferase-like protein (isoleucine patch superfamily)
MAIYQLGERIPAVDPDAYVAVEAVVIGRVQIGAGASVWPGATLRGDNDPIAIGPGTNVQDGAVLHTDDGCPLSVGADVTIGHQAVLHGCTVGAGSLIGIQAVVLNNVVIGRNCLIGAAALVTEGKVIPDNSLVIGAPAKVVRTLNPDEIAAMHANAASYVARGRQFRATLKRLA